MPARVTRLSRSSAPPPPPEEPPLDPPEEPPPLPEPGDAAKLPPTEVLAFTVSVQDG